jgi:hypothetical protein
MEFLACPAYLNDDGSVRCGLPAEVTFRFTMRSSDGPLESVMIQCPARHHFSAPVEFLTFEDDEYLRYGKEQGFTRQSQLVAALDTHPDRPRLIERIRDNGGDM